jgi:hypothetical protein
MNTRTAIPSPIETALHAAVGQLVERATAAPATAADGRRTPWLRWLVALGAVFLAWKAWRGLRSLFWTVFGLGMALFWSGAWHRLF